MAVAKKINYDELLIRCEDDTRHGRSENVLNRIGPIAKAKIPRELVWSFADLAYRNNHLLLALKILNIVMRAKSKMTVPATIKEKTIYATTLLYLGSVEEATLILKTLDPVADPEILLHRSFGLFAHWKYSAAIVHIKNYMSDPKISDYRRLVGEVNLAAAYVFSHQLQKAEETLRSVREKARLQDNQLLYGNSLELSGHLYLLMKNFSVAKQFLDQANTVLSQTKGKYLFYVKKGYAILEVLTSGGSPEALATLKDLRREATELKQWETLRDCDLFEGIATDNQFLLQKILIGTPHSAYRRRLGAIYQSKISVSSNFEFDLRTIPGRKNSVLRVTEGVGADGQSLVRRPVLHQLLETLFLDLYKPAKLGFLFLHIFPNENFNPNSSPARIFGAVHNLNLWLQETKTPLHIRVQDGEFHLEATDGLTIIIGSRRRKKGNIHFELKRLRALVGRRVFKTVEAGNLLEMSKPTVFTILKEGLREKSILKIGQGRSTLYRFL